MVRHFIFKLNKLFMQEVKEKIDQLKGHVKDYVETNIDIAKLTAVDKVSQVAGNSALYVGLLFLGFFFIMLLSIGVALLISKLIGAAYTGFLIVAGFYLLTAVVLFIFRERIILNPIANAMVAKMFKK
jgi:hypothetical protein